MNFKYQISNIQYPKRVLYFLIVNLILVVLVYWIIPALANAQTPPVGRLDITVSPPVIELTAQPGDQLTEKFRVRNNLNENVDLEISVRRLISDPANGGPIPENEAKGEELSWVKFESNEFTARPREWQDITFTIDVPENAAYGYYYVFRITPKGEASLSQSGAQIKGEVLIVTLLNVKKEGAISKTELISFTPKAKISEYLPADFNVKLANKGNVHVKPRGNIFITRGDGKEIGILEVNPGIGSILPGGIREFEASWNEGFFVREPVSVDGVAKLDENGNPVTKLKVNWNKLTSFRIGPYTARLLMVYDDGAKDVTIEGATTFWVIPYKMLGLMALVLIVAIVIGRFLLRWYIRREVAKNRR